MTKRVAGWDDFVRFVSRGFRLPGGAAVTQTTKEDAAPEVPDGWPPNTKPALVIVIGTKVTWAVLGFLLAVVALLAAIAIRLDTLCDVVAVRGD